MSAFAEPVNRPRAAASEKLSPYLRAVLAVVLAADVLDLMDSTITVVAAPSIGILTTTIPRQQQPRVSARPRSDCRR